MQLSDAVLLRIGHRCEQNQGVGAAGAERGDEVLDPALEQVVAEVHDERSRAQEPLGRQHRVREAQRLVLHDVGDADPEAGAVPGGSADLVTRLRRDDDPDLTDAGPRHCLDPVEQHRLVGHRHELLGARVGDRAQTRALAAGEDQTLQCLHRVAEGTSTSRRASGDPSSPCAARRIASRHACSPGGSPCRAARRHSHPCSDETAPRRAR